MPDLWMDVDAALAEVPVNLMPLINDTDFKTIDETIAYNESGMDLLWNFITCAGVFTQTAVTPTTSGVHDWAHAGNGMYTIEIPDTGGTVDNDTEGFGWFTGVCDAVLPWRGPVIGFRHSGLNDALIETGTGLSTVAETATQVSTQLGILKNSTVSGDLVFTMRDSTNHDLATGKTVTGQVSIDGGAFAAVTGAIAEIALGWYKLAANATDRNGDMLAFHFVADGCDPTPIAVLTGE